MAIKRPDIYEHNNPDEPIADTDFVKGGFRTKVADLTALYALAPKINQMKEHATSVWVISENKYYTLVDASNVGNSSGWSDSVLGSGGDFIPLAGTALGAPITGDLVVDTENLGLVSIKTNNIDESENIELSFTKDEGLYMFFADDFLQFKEGALNGTDVSEFQLENEPTYAQRSYVLGVPKSENFTAETNGRYRTTATLTITDTATENYFVQVQSGVCTISGVAYVAGDWIWRVGANSYKINGGGGGLTNLAYTPSPTNGTVTSDTGTDATIPLADGTNAGLISPAEKTKLTGIANNANNYVHPNHSGDVTSVGDGVQTIANQAVTNAKFRDSTAHTVVGRAGAGNGSVADITLGNDTILGREGSGSVEGLSVAQVQSILGFDAKQNIPIVRTGNFTPPLNSVNHITANAIVTNPTGAEGLGYEIEVLNGVTVVNSKNYAKGTKISAKFVSGAWQYTAMFNDEDLEITTSTNISTTAEWKSRIVKIDNSAPINITVTSDVISVAGVKETTQDFTFVPDTGVTLQAVDGTLISSGVIGSTFAIVRRKNTNTYNVYITNR